MPNEVKLLPCEGLNEVIDAIAAAEGVLARVAGDYPDVGTCVIRAVIDVERGNLKRSRQHVLSARALVEADEYTRPTTVVTDEVVERVARAMADDLSKRHYGIDRGPEDAWEAQTDYGRDEWRHAARAALASMPTVVTGEQSQDVGDHALPPSGLSPCGSQAKPAAAIARKGA